MERATDTPRHAEDSRLYCAACRVAGFLMFLAAKYALRVGDKHSFNHLRAAITVGNTGPGRDGCGPDCPHLPANQS